MLTTPPATPVTIPEEEPTVAIVISPLLHVPPPETSDNVMNWPTHTEFGPVIFAGNGLTVTTVVL